MTTLEEYFPKIFVINLARRQDRLRHFLREMRMNYVPVDAIERFDAYDTPHHGMIGATKSHRQVIRRVANGPCERALIFEDDAEVLTLEKLQKAGFISSQDVWKTHCSVLNGMGNLQARFGTLVPFIPAQWDMLWLGGGYGAPPIARVNKHVIRFSYVKNCAAYGISRDFAQRWTEQIDKTVPLETTGAVDDMFMGFAERNRFYIFQPRLIFTGKTKSDVNGLENSYLMNMTDPVAEGMV